MEALVRSHSCTGDFDGMSSIVRKAADSMILCIESINISSLATSASLAASVRKLLCLLVPRETQEAGHSRLWKEEPSHQVEWRSKREQQCEFVAKVMWSLVDSLAAVHNLFGASSSGRSNTDSCESPCLSPVVPEIRGVEVAITRDSVRSPDSADPLVRSQITAAMKSPSMMAMDTAMATRESLQTRHVYQPRF